MKFKIKIHANSSQEKIVKLNNGDKGYEVWIKEKPVDGKANVVLLKLLKKEFGCNFKIKSGFTSRKKVVEGLD